MTNANHAMVRISGNENRSIAGGADGGRRRRLVATDLEAQAGTQLARDALHELLVLLDGRCPR